MIENLRTVFDSWGVWWDVAVVVICIIAFLVWMEVIIGNRIRDRATSLIGIWIETAVNWYLVKKNIAKANARHVSTRKQYHVVILGGRYYVITRFHRKHINRILKKHTAKLTIERVLEQAVYSTK